jgi:hypothetical protein
MKCKKCGGYAKCRKQSQLCVDCEYSEGNIWQILEDENGNLFLKQKFTGEVERDLPE